MSPVPNLISLSRVILSPVFFVLLSRGHKILALLVFSLGAISDFLDGYVARNSLKFGGVSKFGELFDPIADKIFSNTVLWSIYFYHTHTWPFLTISFLLSLRDFLLLFGGAYVLLKRTQISMAPLLISKICTMMIFLLCFATLLTGNQNTNTVDLLSYSSLIIVCITLFCYVRRFIRTL